MSTPKTTKRICRRCGTEKKLTSNSTQWYCGKCAARRGKEQYARMKQDPVRLQKRRERSARAAKLFKERHPMRTANYQQTTRQRRKLLVLSHYSDGSPPRCACCGEQHIEFLTLDHVNGGGGAHRRELGIRGSTELYQWVVRNKFPAGFRVLCMNCNSAIGHFGYCPHRPEQKYRLPHFNQHQLLRLGLQTANDPKFKPGPKPKVKRRGQ